MFTSPQGKRPLQWVALGLMLLSTAATAQDAPVIANPESPRMGRVTLEPTLLWEIGGYSEDEGEFFGVISEITVDDDGRVYLLDAQLEEVKVFSADGEYLHTIGRPGEGPGEFRRPSHVFMLPNGNVGVLQRRPSVVHQFGRDGEILGTLPMADTEDGGFRFMTEGQCRGGSLVLVGGNFRRHDNGGERSERMVRVDMEGGEHAQYFEKTQEFQFSNLQVKETDFERRVWVLGPEGNVFANFGRDHNIQVWDTSGKLLRSVQRDYESRLRSDAELERAKKSMRMFGRRGRGRFRPEIEYAKADRDVLWMHVNEQGYLWVLTSRGGFDAPEGTMGVFDVYDPAGEFVQEVTVVADAHWRDDRFFMAGDRLFVLQDFQGAMDAFRATFSDEETEDLEEEEPEPMAVLCFELTWSPPTGAGR